MKLVLIGDDEDLLDALSELSRHLPYFETARLDEHTLALGALGMDDHVVVAMLARSAAENRLGVLFQLGTPGFAKALWPIAGFSVGERALLVASELVRALHPSSAVDD